MRKCRSVGKHIETLGSAELTVELWGSAVINRGTLKSAELTVEL